MFNMIFQPPSTNLVLPEGYVFGPEREYPVANRQKNSRIAVFDGMSAHFADDYKPWAILGEIRKESSIATGERLSNAGFKIIQAAFIHQEDAHRTVADVIDMDLDGSNSRIIKLLTDGAMIGPSILSASNDKEFFYSQGVGIWASQEQRNNLA